MIDHSTEFAQAITGSSRKLYARAIFDLVSPDAVVGNTASNSVSPISRTQQVSQRGADETARRSPRWNTTVGSWMGRGSSHRKTRMTGKGSPAGRAASFAEMTARLPSRIHGWRS